jgi:Zn-dependent peptidase ImmA (M78 family)
MTYLTTDQIEYEADKLLYDYGLSVAPVAAPPIPVAEIFECHLKFNLQFADLRAKYNDDKVLAEIYILSKKIVVDESLDPDEHPESEGRYNFTLAHEIGHWVLHRHDVIAVAEIPDLFGEIPPPVICRDFSPEPHEWQANQFASHLLMPKEFVLTEWNKFYPEGSMNVFAEIMEKRQRFRLASGDRNPICDCVRKMAPFFHVSLQAMQFRLQALKLLDFNKPEAGLFD